MSHISIARPAGVNPVTGGARVLWRATRPFRPVLALLVALFIYFAVSESDFASSANFQNILTSVSELWVVAMAMTFVVIAASIDLSVAATATFSGVLFAKLIGVGMPGGVALGATIVAATAIGGVLNGVLIGYLRLSFFVVTLASLTALGGVIYLWTGTNSYAVTAPISNQLGIDHLAGLPVPVWIMIVSFAIALYVQRSTYFGRDVYAVGGSPIAARLGGVRNARTIVLVFAIAGGAAGLGGCISVARIGSATPTVDQTLALQAIAGVLLGGTSVFGGAGGVGGTAIGVLFIGVLSNGLSIGGISSFWQQIITGVILIVAVLADRLDFSRLGRRRVGTKS